jgi:hypothetical protein
VGQGKRFGVGGVGEDTDEEELGSSIVAAVQLFVQVELEVEVDLGRISAELDVLLPAQEFEVGVGQICEDEHETLEELSVVVGIQDEKPLPLERHEKFRQLNSDHGHLYRIDQHIV